MDADGSMRSRRAGATAGRGRARERTSDRTPLRGQPTEPNARPAASRFREADSYRAAREWLRYEGTAQRELWRTLRERFLARHSVDAAWVLDVGSGPGRFSGALGSARSRRVALDLSAEMLAQLAERWPTHSAETTPPDRIRGDGAWPPLPRERFGEVALMGNALGFAGEASDRLWEASLELVSPGGRFIVEVAPGPGECSRYLRRLPASSLSRLLRAPIGVLASRIEREGFEVETSRRKESGEFRRLEVAVIAHRLTSMGWSVLEACAIAPVLGPEPDRIEAVHRDPKAWAHLLELEERFGREPARWTSAAAVVLAAGRP